MRPLYAATCLLAACSQGSPISDQNQAGSATGGNAASAGAPVTVSGGGTAGNPSAGSGGGAGAGTGGSVTSAGTSAGGGNGESGAAGAATEPTNHASPGCNAAAALPEGARKLQVGALERSYVVRKPKGYADAPQKPWPLVLALHPNGSGSDYWDVATGARALRPFLIDSSVLILAQGRDNDWRGDVPLDLSYFDALIKEVEANLCLDTQRIFAMGFSGGGSFAGALGCYRTDIRAIAAGGAVIYFEPAECIGKPAAWITIGDGESINARIAYRDFFRTAAACAATTSPIDPTPCVAYTCPDPARPVTFCSHPGGHDWPDFGSKAAATFFAQF